MPSFTRSKPRDRSSRVGVLENGNQNETAAGISDVDLGNNSIGEQEASHSPNRFAGIAVATACS